MDIGGISGSGGINLPPRGSQAIDVTKLIGAFVNYAKEPSVPNAIALISQLRELKAASEQSPGNTQLKGAYDEAMKALSNLPGGADIQQKVEGPGKDIDVGQMLHNALLPLPTDRLVDEMKAIAKKISS